MYPIVGGAILGLCAGQLWAGVNYVALAYADENSKGRFYATQAAMKAMGNLIASALVLGINAHNKTSSSVPLSVYITFICIMLVAMCAALLLVNPEDVRRTDGTSLAVFERRKCSCSLMLKSGRTRADQDRERIGHIFLSRL